MTVADAQEFQKIIRNERFKPNPLQDKFLKDIEIGSHKFHGALTKNQVDWLKTIYKRATE